MPITATCPNPTCGRTLRVGDQYAGKKGKCPSCGGIVAFPVPVEEIEEIVEEFEEVPPPPVTAAAPMPVPKPRKVYQAPSPPAAIAMGAGVFILILLLVSYFLSLVKMPSVPAQFADRIPTVSMITTGHGNVLFAMGLVLIGAVGMSFVFPDRAGQVASVASAYATFVFLCLGSESIYILRDTGLGIGGILGLITSFLAAAVLGAGAGMAGAHLPIKAKKLQGPLSRRAGMLLVSQGLAIFGGLLYLLIVVIIHAQARRGFR